MSIKCRASGPGGAGRAGKDLLVVLVRAREAARPGVEAAQPLVHGGELDRHIVAPAGLPAVVQRTDEVAAAAPRHVLPAAGYTASSPSTAMHSHGDIVLAWSAARTSPTGLVIRGHGQGHGQGGSWKSAPP